MKGMFVILERDPFTWKSPFRLRPLISRGVFYPLPDEAGHVEMNAWVEKHHGTEVKLRTQVTSSLNRPELIPAALSEPRTEAVTSYGSLQGWSTPGCVDHASRLYRLTAIAETLDIIALENNVRIPHVLGDMALHSGSD